jgi:hypothetical protein
MCKKSILVANLKHAKRRKKSEKEKSLELRPLCGVAAWPLAPRYLFSLGDSDPLGSPRPPSQNRNRNPTPPTNQKKNEHQENWLLEATELGLRNKRE